MRRSKPLIEMGHRELVLWLRDLCILYDGELCNLSTGLEEIEEELINTAVTLIQSLRRGKGGDKES